MLIVTVTVIAALTVAVLKRMLWVLFAGNESGDTNRERFLRNRPRLATVTSLLLSILTFAVYFAGIGVVLTQFDVSLTMYFASASIVGLALAFGIQGLVHDVVVGLTLALSREIAIEDVVEIAGNTGRVHSIGLRFLTLVTFDNKRITIPNRSIGTISRFQGGFTRLFVDVGLPDGNREALASEVLSVSRALHRQFRSVILAPPMAVGIGGTKDAPWAYVRIEFRVWPNQHTAIEPTIRGRFSVAMKRTNPDYQDWMITITKRAHAAE
jgi:small conductance mechanosensitive channel